MLNPCPMRNAAAGLPPSIFARSPKLVSRPMQVKARANHQVRKPPSMPLVPRRTLDPPRRRRRSRR